MQMTILAKLLSSGRWKGLPLLEFYHRGGCLPCLWGSLALPRVPLHSLPSGWVPKKILNMIVVTVRKPREHLDQPSQFTHGENGTPQREFTLPADKHQLAWIPSHKQYWATTLLVFVDVSKMPQSRRKEFILWEGKGSSSSSGTCHL